MERKIHVAGCLADISDPEEFRDSVREASGGRAEVYDATAVLGAAHIQVAWEHARRAFDDGRNQCDSLEMETRLYASGERQIKGALQRTGVKAGKVPVALVSENGDLLANVMQKLGLIRDDSLLEATEGKLLKFGIARREIEAIGRDACDLVFERMALQEVERG